MKPKTLFFSSLLAAAAMSTVPAFAETTGSTDSIWINFASDRGTGATGYTGTWNDTTGETGTDISLKYSDTAGSASGASLTYTSNTTWVRSATDGVLKGYLDDGGTGVSVSVSNLSYLFYDVTVFASAEKSNGTYSATTINGQTYTSDGSGNGILGSGTWGDTDTETVGNDNSFTVSGLSGDLSLQGLVRSGSVCGSVAGLIITDTSANFAENATISANSEWADSSLAGTAWEDATSEKHRYANLTLSNSATLDVTGTGITTNAIIATAADGDSKTLTLSGNAVNLIGPGIVRTDSTTANIVINNTLNFANGGKISGNVTTGDKGLLHVSSGELDATALAATAPFLKVSLESGVTYVMDLSAAAATHDLSTITGVSGSVISIAGSSSANTFTGISALSSDFKGAVKITSGFLNLADPSVMNNSGVEKIILSGGTTSGLCFVSAQGIKISKDIVAEGNGGALRSYANNNYSVEFTGNVSGTTIRHYDGGTHTFSGTVDLDSFIADAGVTNFSGTETKTITTLSQTAGTLNFSGTGTTTVGSFTGSSTVNSAPITNIAKGATVDVTNNFVLRYQGDGTSTLNVAGTLSVGGELTLSRDGNGIVNINDGGTLIAGSLGFGQNWDGTAKSSVVNVKTGGTLIANGFTKAFDKINSSSFNLSGGTLGTSADSVTLNVDSLPVVLVAGTTSTINTSKYNTATKTFTETGSTISIANAISGSGALTVTGAGKLTLSGANTFTGNLTVSSGTLEVASTGSLTLSGTTTLSSAISNSGTVTVNSTAVFVLKDALKTSDTSDPSTTTYTLISGNGSISGCDSLAAENFTLDGAVISGRSTVNVETAGKVTITGTAANLVWNGGTSGNWDVQTTKNWTNSDSDTRPADYFVTGDNVTFSTGGDVEVTVDSNGVTAGKMTVSAGTVKLSGGNVTANTANITAGTLSISSDTKLTTNNGITVKDSGTLKISSKTNIGANVTVGTGGTFDLNGATNSISESDTGFGTITLAGGKLVNNGSDVDTDARQLYTLTVTENSAIGGTGNFGLVGNQYGATTLNLGTNTLTKTGDNTLWLVNTTISGNGGTLEATEGYIGGHSGKSIALDEGVTLKTSGSAGVSALSISSMGAGSSLSLSGSGTHTLGSLAVGSDATVNISGSATISGTFSGAGTLNVNDGGVLEMVGDTSSEGTKSANQVKGTVNVKGGGTLKFSGNDLTGWSASTDTVAVLTGDSADKLARLDVNDTGSLTFTHVVAMNGNALISTTSSSSFNTYGGKITATGTNNTISTVGVKIRENFEIEVTNDSDVLEIASPISNNKYGTGGITKTGTGTLILSGDNSGLSTGASSVRRTITVSAGTVVAKTSSALGSTATTVNEGGVLKISVDGGVNVGDGSVTFNENAKFAIDLGAYEGVTADVALTIITASAISFNNGNTNTVALTSDEIESYFSEKNSVLGDFSSYARTWSNDNGTLTLTLTIPEPSTFGLLAGVGALALVAARRRRRAK